MASISRAIVLTRILRYARGAYAALDHLHLQIVQDSMPSNRRSSTTKALVWLGIAGALACAGNTPSPTSTVPGTPGKWVQVWSDEFDGPAGARVDEANWNYETADGCASGNCGWGNNEKEYYTNSPNNIALNGQGQLMIVARSAANCRSRLLLRAVQVHVWQDHDAWQGARRSRSRRSAHPSAGGAGFVAGFLDARQLISGRPLAAVRRARHYGEQGE